MTDSKSPADPHRSLLRASHLSKTFGHNRALIDASLDLRAGEIHGLVGANGAGKSTFINCIAGVVHPDAGTVEVDGAEATIRNPRDASALGLAVVHQHLSLVPKFTVRDNMTLGLVGRNRFGMRDPRPAYARCDAVAKSVGLDLQMERRAADLSVAQQWLAVIGRALVREARILVFDEPTASLSDREAESLFDVVRRLSAKGIGVLYVSHRLDEVEKLCDRVTSFRDGRVIRTLEAAGLTHSEMIADITGTRGGSEAITVQPPTKASGQSGAVLLEARGLCRGTAVLGASVQLRAGEIVGLAGLVGSGRTEFLRLLAGADRPDSGEILIGESHVTLTSPRRAIRRGVVLSPEDRVNQALVMGKSVTFNVNMAATAVGKRSGDSTFVRMGKWRARAAVIARAVDLRPGNVNYTMRQFSGGNQQKIALGRWLSRSPQVLLLDEPTQGIDIAARAQIHQLMRRLADEGIAILLVSSDFSELENCDRVIIMRGGMTRDEFVGPGIAPERMLRAAYEINERKQRREEV